MAAFDAHAHLQDPRIADPGALLARAWAAGVTDIVCCGTEEGDWEAVLALAKAHAGLRPMLGLHPWRVTGASPAWRATLEGLLRASAAGVGECGLDFAMRGADRTAQAAALRFQLGLAQDLGRPVALHCVRAWGPLTELLREVGVPRAGALVHGFGGSADTARELQALGVHLSFSAAFLDPRRT